MTTKTCPSCGAEVPQSATRCKSCFHDFAAEVVSPMKKLGPVFLLASFAGMAVVAVIALTVVLSYPTEQRILVDEATRSVKTITKYRTGIETESVSWDDVEAIVYTERIGEFEVTARTKDGELHTLEKSKEPLKGAASRYAELMVKPLEEESEIGPSRDEN